MKDLSVYIKESLLDVEDFDFDKTVLSELIKPLGYWEVAKDGKTIVYNERSWSQSYCLYLYESNLDIKQLVELGGKFQPIRDLYIHNHIKNWEMLPTDYVKDLFITVIEPKEIDLTKIQYEIEAKLAININRNIDIPIIIPPKQHLKLVSLASDYSGYNLDDVKGWDCDLLCILSKEDTTSITWDGFQGYNEDKIARLVENNPKAKVIYILPNSYSTEVYRVQTKGTGKNKKVSGLLPVSRKSLANRIDKYNIGTFKYMGFRQKNKELFE